MFGDEVQAGADRESTGKWIDASIRILADKIRSTGIEV